MNLIESLFQSKKMQRMVRTGSDIVDQQTMAQHQVQADIQL